MISGQYVYPESPCAHNCSYSIEMTAPSFQCNNSAYPDLAETVNNSYPSNQPLPGYQYLGFAEFNAGSFPLALQWLNPGETTPQNLTCMTYVSNYAVNITYINGKATMDAHVKPHELLTSTGLFDDYAIRPGENHPDTPITSSSVGTDGQNILEINRQGNIAAVVDSIARPLTGYISIPSAYSVGPWLFFFFFFFFFFCILTKRNSPPRLLDRKYHHIPDQHVLRLQQFAHVQLIPSLHPGKPPECGSLSLKLK